MAEREHPIWGILRHKGLTWAWLARRTHYSAVRVRAFACGMAEPSPEFRQRAATVLDLPEATLFLERPVTETETADLAAS